MTQHLREKRPFIVKEPSISSVTGRYHHLLLTLNIKAILHRPNLKKLAW